MDGIRRENIRNTLISVARYGFGAFFLIMFLGALLEHGYIAVLLFLLAAIIAIPLTATALENKLNLKMSNPIRFLALFVLLIVSAATLPPSTNTAINNSTESVAAPPSNVSGDEAIAVPSEPEQAAISNSMSNPVNTSATSLAPTTPNVTTKNSTSNTVNKSTPTPAQKAVSTPATIPAQKLDNKGKLDILTNPAGATVTVDGVSKGVSPIEGLSVESGTHSVTVYLSGYKPQKETVKIANSETKKLLYNLVSEETPIHNPTPTQEETPTTEVTPTSTPTAEESTSPVVSKTPMSLSESKKKELIEVVKQYYGGKDVFVDYGNGVMLVSYSIDSIPNPSDLYDDIQGVLISADYTAGQSGITDVRVVNVVVTTTSERGLGVGNYYVAGERKTFDIDVSDCHP